MSKATYFVQECPTCGRRLQVRVEYLGKRVQCQHCRGQFQAADSAAMAKAASESAILMARADELLASASSTRQAG